MPDVRYVGRFAPSPTGPLHFGSLLAALASYLDARANDGKWLVRVEDIDPPREVPGASRQILNTLERLHLHWDDDVLYQSTRIDAYRDYTSQMLADQIAFRCRCSRSQLAGQSIYPGTCYGADVGSDTAHAIRVHVDGYIDEFTDRVQGKQRTEFGTEVGDFVIWRRDGLPAYQLAVTVDDAFQNVTEIVRGGDLLDSCSRQNFLRHQLGFAAVRHAHIPVVVNADGQKLSKQSGAAAIDKVEPAKLILTGLHALQHSPPPEYAHADLDSLLQWAVNHWNINNLRDIGPTILTP